MIDTDGHPSEFSFPIPALLAALSRAIEVGEFTLTRNSLTRDQREDIQTIIHLMKIFKDLLTSTI